MNQKRRRGRCGRRDQCLACPSQLDAGHRVPALAADGADIGLGDHSASVSPSFQQIGEGDGHCWMMRGAGRSQIAS